MKSSRIFQNRSLFGPFWPSRVHPRRVSNRHAGSGFTLIEIIVTLILVGILATMAGFGIVQAVQGYMFSRGNAELTQKAQLAMSRITREIVEMTGLISNQTPTDTSLPVANVERNVILGLHSNTIKVAPEGTSLSGGDVLIDNVNAFNLTYWKGDKTWTTWDDVRELSAIDVTLTLNRPDGGTMVFANRVSPRNNKNLGGAPPDIEPPTMPSYNLCFVATAAFGNDTHPAVVLLREFRDHFLLTWKGGRWLVDQYYTHGPALAALIENRPLAQWGARLALYPVAVLTFLVLYAPWAGLSVILVLGLLAKALLSRKPTRKMALLPNPAAQKGSILIGLIAAIVVMSALGAAMLPMFSSSYMNQAYSDHGRKAYFLAESGFRYAASEYLNAGSTSAKDAVLAEIHEKTFNLNNNQGSFTTRVYPFWTESSSFSGSTLSSTISGTIPDELKTGTGGYIRVEDSGFFSYSSRSGSGTTVSFSGLSPATNPGSSKEIFPIALPNSTQTIAEGGNLTLSSTGADAFPPLNGNFTIATPLPAGVDPRSVFNYEKRVGNTLYNITLADSNQTWTNFQVTSGAITSSGTTKFVLEKFLRLSSTGNYQGSSREIVYNVPLGWLPEGSEFKKEEFHDKFDSGSNWFISQSVGGHAVSSGKMQVTGMIQPGQTQSGLLNWLGGILGWIQNHGRWAVVALNWGNLNTNLAQAWHDAGGNLSYDIQVKVNNDQPYFFAGLGFRMRNNANDTDLHTYGVSFVRQRETRSVGVLTGTIYRDWEFDDDIHPDLRPDPVLGRNVSSSADIGYEGLLGLRVIQARYKQPYIVLWQRIGPSNSNAGSFKILAHRAITSNDGITTGSGTNLRLKPWTTLMVRLIEGEELSFNSGRSDSDGRHIKYGDIITNSNGTKSARVIGTPVMETDWGGNNTTVGVGRLMLTNVTGSRFSNGDSLYLKDTINNIAYGVASSGQATSKVNHILVYFSDDKSPAAGNNTQVDEVRIGNTREYAKWPPDDRTDLVAGLPSSNPPGNDYSTLIQWYGTGLGTQMAPAITTGNWNIGSGWSISSSQLRKDSSGTGTARPSPSLSISAGVTYDVSFDVTNWGGSGSPRNFSYTLGGVNGGTITSNGNYTNTITATGSGNLIFTPTDRSRFRISNVSVIPHVNIQTLDQTADAQGNIPSYVDAPASSDFHWSVIRTGALNSPVWSGNLSDFGSGDHISLVTSSSAGTSTQYDDFAIQLDMKAGSGFLPPIQQ